MVQDPTVHIITIIIYCTSPLNSFSDIVSKIFTYYSVKYLTSEKPETLPYCNNKESPIFSLREIKRHINVFDFGNTILKVNNKCLLTGTFFFLILLGRQLCFWWWQLPSQRFTSMWLGCICNKRKINGLKHKILNRFEFFVTINYHNYSSMSKINIIFVTFLWLKVKTTIILTATVKVVNANLMTITS